jgi:hypothetical protein
MDGGDSVLVVTVNVPREKKTDAFIKVQVYEV